MVRAFARCYSFDSDQMPRGATRILTSTPHVAEIKTRPQPHECMYTF